MTWMEKAQGMMPTSPCDEGTFLLRVLEHKPEFNDALLLSIP